MRDERIEVVFLGYQEQADGTAFLLVNEVKSHSTVGYDKKEHILVKQTDHDEERSKSFFLAQNRNERR